MLLYNNTRVTAAVTIAAVSIGLLLQPVGPTMAATVKIAAEQNATKDAALVHVLISSDGQTVNAVEGRLTYRPDLLTLKEIRTGNSIIAFWVEYPHATGSGNTATISFGGVIPGGWTGTAGNIFSALLVGAKGGTSTFALSNLRVLLHDGKGTEALIKTASQTIVTAAAAAPLATTTIAAFAVADTTPPEPFTPRVARNKEMYENRWFVVFATQDKDGGIAAYEIKEGNSAWENAISPYVLKNQKRDVTIIVRATDLSGNTREATIPPQSSTAPYPLFLAGAAFIALIALTFWRRRFRSSPQNDILD